jgi:predicted Zn-dependent peptidase
MVLWPRFSAAAVEKEKEIIVQEIRMYEDNPDWRALNALVRGLYAAHPVRNDITGTVESVRSIDHSALLRCHRAFYDPGNLCLVVSGDVVPREVAEVALEETAGLRTAGRVVRLRARERRRVLSARVEERLPVTRGKLLVGYKDRAVPRAGEALRRRDLLTAVLLAMMFGAASPARNRLYEAGLIDDSFYASYAGEEDFGFVTFGIETDEPERARRALLAEIRRFGRAGLDNEEFGRAIHKITGHFVRGLDSQEGTAFLLLSAALRGLDPFLVPALLRRVTPEEVQARFAELFAPGGHTTSVVRR